MDQVKIISWKFQTFLAGKPLFRRVIGSGDFTQELLARLSPVTELGHLRPLACDTTGRDVRRTRTASVESVVATQAPAKMTY